MILYRQRCAFANSQVDLFASPGQAGTGIQNHRGGLSLSVLTYGYSGVYRGCREWNRNMEDTISC